MPRAPRCVRRRPSQPAAAGRGTRRRRAGRTSSRRAITAARSAGVVERVQQPGEVPGVLLVERAVRAQVGESAGRAGRGLPGCDPRRAARARRWCLPARAPCRRSRPGCRARWCRRRRPPSARWPARAPRRTASRVAAAGGDVVEDPLVVAGLLVDVLVERGRHPGEPRRQARAAGLQQRHGVADVVVGLGQERAVARAPRPRRAACPG